MRVAIAGQEAAVVEVLRRVIASTPEHELLWVTDRAARAVERCETDRPDVLLLGLSMPATDVVDATRRIRRDARCGIILVTTSVQRDSAMIFAAMGAGALDVVTVPVAVDNKGKALTAQILQKIRMAGVLSSSGATAPSRSRSGQSPDLALVAICASAGGPPAIASVLRDLPADLPAAIVVVQHIDAKFSDAMAAWLSTQTDLDVRIARNTDELQRGIVYLAAGDRHLVVSTEGVLGYTIEPTQSAYHPSGDVLLESIAHNWRGTAIGIVLSGMGSDGASGLRTLRDTGARTIAQDQATSAVYGMPRAAAENDAATDILALAAIGPLVRELVQRRTVKRDVAVS